MNRFPGQRGASARAEWSVLSPGFGMALIMLQERPQLEQPPAARRHTRGSAGQTPSTERSDPL